MKTYELLGYPEHFRFTQDVRDMAEKFRLYWFIQIVFDANQYEEKVQDVKKQTWVLLARGDTGEVFCYDEDQNPVFHEEIAYLDLPASESKFFVDVEKEYSIMGVKSGVK